MVIAQPPTEPLGDFFTGTFNRSGAREYREPAPQWPLVELGSQTTWDVLARLALVEVLIHQVSSNDEVERRGASPASNEGILSQSSIPSLVHRRRDPRSLEPIVRTATYRLAHHRRRSLVNATSTGCRTVTPNLAQGHDLNYFPKTSRHTATVARTRRQSLRGVSLRPRRFNTFNIAYHRR